MRSGGGRRIKVAGEGGDAGDVAGVCVDAFGAGHAAEAFEECAIFAGDGQGVDEELAIGSGGDVGQDGGEGLGGNLVGG